MSTAELKNSFFVNALGWCLNKKLMNRIVNNIAFHPPKYEVVHSDYERPACSCNCSEEESEDEADDKLSNLDLCGREEEQVAEGEKEEQAAEGKKEEQVAEEDKEEQVAAEEDKEEQVAAEGKEEEAAAAATTTTTADDKEEEEQTEEDKEGGKEKDDEKSDWDISELEKDVTVELLKYHTQEKDNKTKRRKVVGLIYIKLKEPKKSKFTIFFSHHNAVNVIYYRDFYVVLATELQCNVFSYDYSGYGDSSGRPSEKNLYKDCDLAFTSLNKEFGIEGKDIILFGESIGIVPTIHLASKYDVAGVILRSPFKSGLELAFPSYNTSWFCYNPFPNYEKVDKITAPVLVIHGRNDEIMPFEQGVAIYEKCQRATEPLWTEDDHSINITEEIYLKRLKEFIKQLEEERESIGENPKKEK